MKKSYCFRRKYCSLFYVFGLPEHSVSVQLLFRCLLIAFVVFTSCGISFAQTWNSVGSPDFSIGNTYNTSIAINGSGTPYVVYTDCGNGCKATALKFNGSSWVTVGTAGFSGGVAESPSIAIDDSGTPYVVYGDGVFGPVTVMKYDGGSWVNVGSPGFSAGEASYTSIAIDGSGTPYVAYQDTFHGQATVMKYNGSSWVFVGSRWFSAGMAQFTSIAIDVTGTPYVIYEDYNGAATVMKFNGGSWVTVGSPRFSAGQAGSPSIAIDRSGTPYVAYSDGNIVSTLGPATVMKYNGSSWVAVGSPGFSAASVIYTSIAIDSSGAPYVVYGDSANSHKATVMKYNGSSWVAAGNVGFSAGGTQYTSIAIDHNGTPYVAYGDSANNEKATVMKLGASNEVKNISNHAVSTLTVYPNPVTHNLFTCNITTPINEAATIVINDILGQVVFTTSIATNTPSELSINVPPGLYFITASTATNKMQATLVVE